MTKLGKIVTKLAEATTSLDILYLANSPHFGHEIESLKEAVKLLMEYNTEYALNAETYKMLRDEAQAHHEACIKDAYKILGIDGSDGEYRYKWVALKMGQMVRELDVLRRNTVKLGPQAHMHTGAFKECPLCDGDGYLPGDSPGKRCTRCNGNRKVPA